MNLADSSLNIVSRLLRTNFIVHCREKQFKCDIFSDGSSKNLYVNEHLTRNTAQILGLTRKLRPPGYRVETRDCSVFIKNKEDARLKISRKQQIIDILIKEGIPFKL